LALATTLELCAATYPRFCERYKPQAKPERKNRWGSKLLAQITAGGKPKHKVSPGQKSLWEEWDLPAEEIRQVAEKFVKANEFPPDRAKRFPDQIPDPSPGGG
jgi:putative transposase